MFQRSENEWNRLLRIAWELGLTAGNRNLGNDYEILFDAISGHLHTAGWSLQKGTRNRASAFSRITWTQEKCSHSFPREANFLSVEPPLIELMENAIRQAVPASILIQCDVEGDQRRKEGWYVLKRFMAFPDSSVECVAFAKPSQAQAFTELEKALVDEVLRMLSNQSRIPDEQDTKDKSDSLTKDSLPKRQREVLELLLKGSSIKEIAAELKISRHTVNDYSKALYRHFDVSGRAELAAIFRYPAQLELSHAD